MTKLTLNIESSSLADFVRQILGNLRGVRIVSDMETEISKVDDTTEFINRFAGAWTGNESAEDIISTIHENSRCKEPISFD